MVNKFMERVMYKGYTISTLDKKEWTLQRGFTPISVRSVQDAKDIIDGTKTLQEV